MPLIQLSQPGKVLLARIWQMCDDEGRQLYCGPKGVLCGLAVLTYKVKGQVMPADWGSRLLQVYDEPPAGPFCLDLGRLCDTEGGITAELSREL